MSLLDEYARPCTLMEKTRLESDEGGWKTTWTDGATFQNYQALNVSAEANIADADGLTHSYHVLVSQDVPIVYNDYFRDDSTGNTYRVTSDPEDRKSPASASLSLKYFTAEREDLPT